MRCPQRVLSPAWPQPPVGLTEWHKGCRKWDGAGRGVALGELAPHFFHGGDSSAWAGDALRCWGRGGQAEPCSPSCTGLAPCVLPQGGMRMQTLALTPQQGAARLPGALPLLEEGVCQQWKIQVPSCRAEPWSCRAVVSRGPLSLSSRDCLPLPALRENAGGYSEQWGQNGDVLGAWNGVCGHNGHTAHLRAGRLAGSWSTEPRDGMSPCPSWGCPHV